MPSIMHQTLRFVPNQKRKTAVGPILVACHAVLQTRDGFLSCVRTRLYVGKDTYQAPRVMPSVSSTIPSRINVDRRAQLHAYLSSLWLVSPDSMTSFPTFLSFRVSSFIMLAGFLQEAVANTVGPGWTSCESIMHVHACHVLNINGRSKRGSTLHSSPFIS